MIQEIYEQSCITCRYSEESYEDILGAGGQPETILVRRCPFVNDEIVNDDFLCGKFKSIGMAE